ncbi:MAG: hypothetical protein HFG70_13175 [Hungatella sp.]|nr:hypothetical protein [Hungatella sp.]
MFQFFDSVAAFVDIIVNFVVNMFQLLFTTVVSIIRAVTWLQLCIAYLPGWLTAFILVPVALAVVFQILNKGG